MSNGHYAMSDQASGLNRPAPRPWPAGALGLVPWFVRRRLGRALPLLASFKLTWRCNLSCRGCPFFRRAADHPRDMSWDTAVACLQELRRWGCVIVMFEGGEPLLWHDGRRTLPDLIDYARKLFFRVGVTTNGTLGCAVPADVVWVSLDGLQQTHDRLRSNSFGRVWQCLSDGGHPKLLVHVTVNRENLVDLAALIKEVTALPAVRGVTAQFFYPYDQGEAPLGLSRTERAEAVRTLLHLKRRGLPVYNSGGVLKKMVANTWRCVDDILINVDPDGEITHGCYVRGRGQVHCSQCGFTPVAEAVAAVGLRPGALRAGWKTFIAR